jgi:succinate dehydrogenase / fumarate reductase cytochrome b subunit
VTSPASSSHAPQHHDASRPRLPAFSTTSGRAHFVLRRLHSLAGAVFGAYIVVHLAVNASGLSPLAYQMNVDRIHSLEPSLPFIEIAAIFAPLLLHMLYGIYVAWFGVKYNTTQYNYGGNLRYALQRWTSLILVLFILFHIATLHKWGFHLVYRITHLRALEDYSTMGLFNPRNVAFQTTVRGIRYFWNDQSPANPGNIAVMAFYLLGVWSAVFHFANGMWTGAIAWGLTVTANAQRRWGHICLMLGIALFIIGTAAWAAFTIAPAAQGNVDRWDYYTHTLPDESEPSLDPPSPQPPLVPPASRP